MSALISSASRTSARCAALRAASAVGADLRTARALVYHGRRGGSSYVSQAGLQYALFLGVFGLIFPGVDNYAHAGGFAGGYLAGLVLDPLKQERVDHMVMALLCLLLTAVALGASFITALPLLLAG